MLSPALRAAFSARIARRNMRISATGFSFDPGTAAYCLDMARQDVALDRDPATIRRPASDVLGHGSVIRSRTPTGERRTYVVAIIPDTDMGAPWEAHDGHGDITEAARGSDAKAPGERVLQGNGRGATRYLYDVESTQARALSEGWGLRADHAAALERKLGREPTRRERAAEAVRLDFELCRDWLNDEWNWIGVALIEMSRPHGGNPESIATAFADGGGHTVAGEMRASLWGIESYSEDYHHTVALELVSEANAA